MHGVWVWQCFSILVKPCKQFPMQDQYRCIQNVSAHIQLPRSCQNLAVTENLQPLPKFSDGNWWSALQKPAQGRQSPSELPATAKAQGQPLSAAGGVIEGAGEKQSVLSRVLPGAPWSLRPLCVCVLWLSAQLCGPDAGPKAASLLPSLRCEFPSAWLNSYSISQAQPDPFPAEPFRLILLQKVSARIFVSIKLLISYLHHFCYSILGQ